MNPRCRFCQHTRFPVVLLQPLGHLSLGYCYTTAAGGCTSDGRPQGRGAKCVDAGIFRACLFNGQGISFPKTRFARQFGKITMTIARLILAIAILVFAARIVVMNWSCVIVNVRNKKARDRSAPSRRSPSSRSFLRLSPLSSIPDRRRCG